MKATTVRDGFLGLLGCLLIAACGGGHGVTAPTDPALAAVGDYQLALVNGQTVPVPYYQDASGTLTITGGTLALRSDRSYTETETMRASFSDGSPSQNQNLMENGTFQVTGTQITFTIPADVNGPALSYTGAVNGGVVSYTYNGDSFEYHKQ